MRIMAQQLQGWLPRLSVVGQEPHGGSCSCHMLVLSNRAVTAVILQQAHSSHHTPMAHKSLPVSASEALDPRRRTQGVCKHLFAGRLEVIRLTSPPIGLDVVNRRVTTAQIAVHAGYQDEVDPTYLFAILRGPTPY